MATESATELQLARFRLGDALFGIEIMKVHEVLNGQRITPVPGAPAFIEGVVEVRGDYLPVIDLRGRVGANAGSEHKIIIADAHGRRVGLVVDQVFDVYRTPLSELQQLDPLAKTAAYAGIVKAEQGSIIVIDPDGLLGELEAGQLDKLALPAQ